MEGQFQILFDKMKIEIQSQTTELKQSITKSIMDKIDDKLIPLVEENKNLKIRVEKLEKEIEVMKRVEKKNNIIKENNIVVFGLEEKETSTLELLQEFKKHLNQDLNIKIENYEINKIHRLGAKNREINKPRPVLCSFVNNWRKYEIIKNKKNLIKINISEDYSKEVLEKRKGLQAKLAEERKKGNIAYLKYDKLVVIEGKMNQDKRKREASTSPTAYHPLSPSNQPKKHQIIASIKANRTNVFDMMRGRSNSLSNISTTEKQ
ncbi:uncharacterized protein LOC111353298 [Spodoptera litura]|uniref:Uncharacterized protein LOC111351910 n=1 Tax=Spodoptera litura TaxID=69820 RepID=A0A9J7INV4_SPOLT|nr:uncharacterized protein LOC111351910 [Spodoptera litura]XP_022822028.1 uncharacterized protein LOC111353298 [Spodoptera litura]